MKRFLTLLALMAICICSYAYDFEEGGIYYDITSSTEQTVSVTYGNSNYNSYSGFVVIPLDVTYNGITYSVTSIGNYAFRSCMELFYITIPNSVTSIGSSAFYDCSNLTSINIPNSVTSIGSSAFCDCSNLTSINIPNSVKSIGKGAFTDCSSLISITIPNSITRIVQYTFRGCSSLTSITIGNSVTRIDNGAFSGCIGLTSIIVDENNPIYDSRENCNAIIETNTNALIIGSNKTTIPNSVTSIGGSAFYGYNSLTSVTIPNSVTSIGSYAFSGCSSLTSVIIPNSVTSIEWSAFSDCSSLNSITIPNSVTYIGSSAFENCSQLSSINVEKDNSKYDSRDNCNAIIETGTNTLIAGCKNTIIQNSVTSIGNYAFSGCSCLTSITIPYSVTSIGDYAFYNCSDLTTVTIGNSVRSIGKSAFQSCPNLSSVTNRAKTPQSIGDDAFSRHGTMHVLKGFKDVYETSDWNKYFFIKDDLVAVLAEGFIIDVDNQHFDVNVGGLRANVYPTNKEADYWSVTWSTTTPSVMMVIPMTGDFIGLTDGIGELVATADDGSGVVAKAKVYFGTAQPDAIEPIHIQDKKNNKVYNLNGTMVNSNNLPAGIYIKNGKKVVMK